MSETARSGSALVSRNDFPLLFKVLGEVGYELIRAPLRNRAIVYDTIGGVKDRSVGWLDEQESGSYGLKRRNDAALFDFHLGPDSWKKFPHQPSVRLWKADKVEQGFQFCVPDNQASKQAFIGIRSCERRAITIQNWVMTKDRYVEPRYAANRQNFFTVAVQCTQAASTCFCTSMDTGPEARTAYDFVLTELVDLEGHRLLYGRRGCDRTRWADYRTCS